MIGLGFSAADLRRVAWTAVQAFVSAFLMGLAGVWQAVTDHGISGGRSALIALCLSAGAAAISAVKNFVLADASRLK